MLSGTKTVIANAYKFVDFVYWILTKRCSQDNSNKFYKLPLTGVMQSTCSKILESSRGKV